MDWPYLLGYALMMSALPVLIAMYVIRRRHNAEPAESFDEAVDDALDIFAVDEPAPCLCDVCEELTDDVAEYGFSEILNGALSRDDFRRFKRLGALFPPSKLPRRKP